MTIDEVIKTFPCMDWGMDDYEKFVTLLRAGEACAVSISDHNNGCPENCERHKAYAEWEAAKRAILE